VRLLQNPEAFDPYLVDESAWRGHAEGLLQIRQPEEILLALAAAEEAGTHLTFSARRTSLTGASIPEGGWILALPEASDLGMAEIDKQARLVKAPAQILISDLEAAVEAAGFFLPVDPTSRKTASLGGSIACNASGARSFAHGPIGRWIEALDVILADGARFQLRRGEHPPKGRYFELSHPKRGLLKIPCPAPRPKGLKSSLGYALFDPPDLLDLFIGSEGSLGYIEAAELRLLPRQPIFALLSFWRDEAALLDFVVQLQEQPPRGLRPMSVEFFDRRSLELASAAHPRLRIHPLDQGALFLEQRHQPDELDDLMMDYYDALVEAGVPDDDRSLRIPRSRADLDSFREFRHAVPEAINSLARVRGLRKLGTDLAYPRSWLKPMMAHYRAAVEDLPGILGDSEAAEFQERWAEPLPQRLDSATFGHIGDNHLHLNLLATSLQEMAAGQRLYAALARHCVSVGGVISGEHGIGKSKRGLLAELLPSAQLQEMREIKQQLDPRGTLGRGNIFT